MQRYLVCSSEVFCGIEHLIGKRRSFSSIVILPFFYFFCQSVCGHIFVGFLDFLGKAASCSDISVNKGNQKNLQDNFFAPLTCRYAPSFKVVKIFKLKMEIQFSSNFLPSTSKRERVSPEMPKNRHIEHDHSSPDQWFGIHASDCDSISL